MPISIASTPGSRRDRATLPDMTGEPAIVVTGASKRYGDRTVLADVSLAVRPGELVALLGPNGAGKTTTVEIIEGYRRADTGSVRVLGVDPQAGGPGLRSRVGIMLQGGGFDPRARPRETIVQYGRFHRSPRDADELVALCGLEGVVRTPVRRLSGGERQRLALAVALVGRPEVAILDEPTAGMDPEARAVTRRIITDLRAEGVAILLTSHDLSDVERLADRIHILDDGRLVASGSPADLAADLRPTLRFRLARPLSGEETLALGVVAGSIAAGARLRPDADDPSRILVADVLPDAALVAAVAAWCSDHDVLIVELQAGGGSLEDAYLALVGRDRGRGS
jgi:ABC-2 type transport system ATP-binding protein